MMFQHPLFALSLPPVPSLHPLFPLSFISSPLFLSLDVSSMSPLRLLSVSPIVRTCVAPPLATAHRAYPEWRSRQCYIV